VQICHYLCFDADQRISMQIYADSLNKALSGIKELELNRFKPTSKLSRFSNNRTLMRYLRYYHYPRSVAGVDADIHHVLDHGYAHLQAKLGKGMHCVTVHDLIPLLTWRGLIESSSPIRKPILNLHSLSYLSKFDKIITISQSTADDLVEYLDIEPQRISVIPPVIGDHFVRSSELAINTFRQRYRLDSKTRWLLISGREYYKNHHTSLKVLQALQQHIDVPVGLIKIGLPCSEFNQSVAQLGLSNQVRNIYLEDPAELVDVYSMVDCLLFPSLYEGFGMPVAEALACGTPVITSNRGSLPEVVGDLAPKLDPFDVQGLSKAVKKTLLDESIKKRILSDGPNWVMQFKQQTVVPQLEKFYRA